MTMMGNKDATVPLGSFQHRFCSNLVAIDSDVKRAQYSGVLRQTQLHWLVSLCGMWVWEPRIGVGD